MTDICIDREKLLERFLHYARIDTQSDPSAETIPSTEKQWVLIRRLEKELRELGLADVRVTGQGCIYATVLANTDKPKVPVVAFLAHVDTVHGCSGAAKPRVHRNYRGQEIEFPDDPTARLSPRNCPELGRRIGHDIITASGGTLLGADDKAGIAAIMEAAGYLLSHPEIPHGKVRVCFTADEETGRGPSTIALDELGADVAYTLDSHGAGTLDAETFSADRAVVSICGVAAHPGWAKGVMVNAIRLAGEFLALLPAELSPERTEGREGFIHPTGMRGTAEEVTIDLILRDFEMAGLEAQHRLLRDAVARLVEREPRARIELDIQPQYRNMRYRLETDDRPVAIAKEAIRRAGLEPRVESVRGGTDGAHLTERGLPTPNLFAGMQEIHSPREWASLQDMAKAADVVVRLARLWEERA